MINSLLLRQVGRKKVNKVCQRKPAAKYPRLAAHSYGRLKSIKLNDRPRKALNYNKPNEVFNKVVALKV